MNEESKNPGWPTAALVVLFSGIGGTTAWVWSITIGTSLDLSGTAAIAANIFLSVIAGFVGAFSILRIQDQSTRIPH